MTMPVKLVYDLLMDNEDVTSIVDPLKIFMLDVPEDDKRIDHFPVIRLNEVNDKQNSFSSNVANTVQSNVQVDVWSNDYAKLDKLQHMLDKCMANNQWVQYSGGIDTDPDTQTPRLYRRYRAVYQVTY